MNMKFRIVVSVVCLSTVLACGCKKNEETAPPPPQKSEAAPVSTPQAQPATGQGFSATLPPELAGKSIAKGGYANAEELNYKKLVKSAEVKSKDGFTLFGWAVSNTTKSVPVTVFVELAPVKGGESYYVAATRYDRPDVATYLKDPAYQNAGYKVKEDIKSVPPGEYDINVIQVDNGNALRVSTTKKINKTN
jgi:hypothetical protein